MSDIIKIDSGSLETVVSQLAQVQNSLDEAYNKVNQVRSNLDWEISIKENVDYQLQQLNLRIRQQNEKLCQMASIISTAIQESSDMNNSLTNETQNITLGFALGAGAAITAGWGSLKESLASIVAEIEQILSKMDEILHPSTPAGQENSGQSGEASSGIADEGVTPPVTPPTGGLQLDTQVSKSKKYGDADVWNVIAWTGNMDRSVWPDGYNGNSGCAVASVATALSTIGVYAPPKEIMKDNSASNPEYMTGKGWEAEKFGVDLSTSEPTLENLDQALLNYQQNPGTYSAPIIRFNNGYKGGNPHYVVVTGKNSDGSYNIVDSSGNNMTTYRFTADPNDCYMDKANKTFYADLVGNIRQYKKN